MKEALIINVLILLLIGLVIATTGNALALVCVVLLRDMPYGLVVPEGDEVEVQESEYAKRGIGFHTE